MDSNIQMLQQTLINFKACGIANRLQQENQDNKLEDEASKLEIFREVLGSETCSPFKTRIEDGYLKFKKLACANIVNLNFDEDYKPRELEDEILREALRSSEKRETIIEKRAKFFETCCHELNRNRKKSFNRKKLCVFGKNKDGLMFTRN